jgi:hypothetical protein
MKLNARKSAKPNVKKSLMRSNAHTTIKPKGFPSGTPLVFLLHCARTIVQVSLFGAELIEILIRIPSHEWGRR